MPQKPKGLYELGGLALVASGVLFLARAVLDFATGPPPLTGAEILAWTASAEFVLAVANELLFFAALCLVPAVTALYRSLADIDRGKAVTGCGIIAATIPVLALLDIVHGRLVFPVYGIRITTPALAEFAVAMFYGGLHAVAILLGIATVVLSLAMRRAAYGKGIAHLGLATGVLDVVGAYPDAIGPVPTLICQAFFAAWFVAVGVKLHGMR